jgi:hypothetical protein
MFIARSAQWRHAFFLLLLFWIGVSASRVNATPSPVSVARDHVVIQRSRSVLQQAIPSTSPGNGSNAEIENARNDLKTIFERREFRGLTGPSLRDQWKARLSRWLMAKVAALLRRLHVNATVGNTFGWIVVALAFAVLGYWTWRTLSRHSRPVVTHVGLPAATQDLRRWVDDAVAAAERGDYREAIHCAYWAGVSRLEDAGILKRDRARTPREALRLLDSHPDAKTRLGDLTRRFELVWYGYRSVSAADWSGARLQLEQMGCLKPSTAQIASSS